MTAGRKGGQAGRGRGRAASQVLHASVCVCVCVSLQKSNGEEMLKGMGGVWGAWW